MDFPVRTLHEQIAAAGIPFTGVNIGVINDRTTWSVFFAPTATKVQKQQASDIIAAFDVTAAQTAEGVPPTTLADKIAAILVRKGVILPSDLP